MPELPDIETYLTALRRFIEGRVIESVQVRSPFLVRTFDPEVQAMQGQTIVGFQRLGKRIVWELTEDLFAVFHLMIAGRFHWKKPGVAPRSKIDLAAFGFDHGVLMLTEASAKKRASLHLVRGAAALDSHRRSGLEPLDCTLETFRSALLEENHTVKRSLTDPSIFSGIGNAYSDEILHAARLSPIKWTSRLTDEEIERLFVAVQSTLKLWTDRLTQELGDKFPKKVTAFRPEMAVHGRFGKPCPECGQKVQRIVYAANETNYCAVCQTDGKVLADRSLSRLLKDDWPRTIE